MSLAIEFIHGRQILDSRGNPTVEVDVILEDGTLGRAAVPPGASTGEHEAVELRDDDKKKYLGKSVYKAVENINSKIAPELIAPDLKDNEDALKVIGEAVEAAGYKFGGRGGQIFVALDPACSELWDKEKKGYKFFKSNPDKILSSDEMIDYWAKWVDKYPIRSIEDGLAENDWDGWKQLTDRLGQKIQLVGDDLFVTNVKFLEKGIKTGTANAILV